MVSLFKDINLVKLPEVFFFHWSEFFRRTEGKSHLRGVVWALLAAGARSCSCPGWSRAQTPLSPHCEITARAELGCCKSCSPTAAPAVPEAASSSCLIQTFLGISFLWQGSVREYGGGSSVGIYICVAPGPTHSS